MPEEKILLVDDDPTILSTLTRFLTKQGYAVAGASTGREAVAALKLDIQVEEIKDIKEIMQYHILMTPGLVINEKVVMSGKVPSRAEIERLIKDAIHAQG